MRGPRELTTDEHFRWLQEGWDAEIPSAIHRRGGRKRAGEFTSNFRRILDDRYIRWFVEWQCEEVEGPGGTTVRIPIVDERGRFVPKRDERGRVVRYRQRPFREADPDDWVMPVHEAMKRLRGKGAKPRLEWHWLNEILRWRGMPCVCGHADVVECVATRSRTTPEIVTKRVRALARQAARIVGLARDHSVPQEGEGHASDHHVPQAHQATR